MLQFPDVAWRKRGGKIGGKTLLTLSDEIYHLDVGWKGKGREEEGKVRKSTVASKSQKKTTGRKKKKGEKGKAASTHFLLLLVTRYSFKLPPGREGKKKKGKGEKGEKESVHL